MKLHEQVFTLGAMVSLPAAVLASSSGLNNIPTADTAPHRTLVLQHYPTLGVGRSALHFAGFKFGIAPGENRAGGTWGEPKWQHRFEFGLDGRAAAHDAGPALLQTKYTMQPRAGLPALGVGIANVAPAVEHRQRAGQPFVYTVLTHDLRMLRVHAGYALQAQHNNSMFLGVDKSVKLFRRDLIIRGDAIQTEHRQNWLTSVGGLYAFCKYFVLESWWNQPVHRSPGSITIKFNIVMAF